MTFEDYVNEHLERANLSHKGLELVRMGWNARGEFGDALEGGEAVAWHVLHSDGNVDLRPRRPAFLPQDAADAEVIIRPLVFGDTQPSTSMQEDWWVNLIDRAVPDLSPEPDQGQYTAEWALWADHQRIRQEIATAVLCTPHPADNWIKCSERLPTEADADCDDNVWLAWPDGVTVHCHYKRLQADVHASCFWMPTNLKRPNPPAEGADDE